MKPHDDVIDLFELARLLWSKALLLIAVTILGGACGYSLATFAIAPTYRASADMLVNNTQEPGISGSVTTGDLTASGNLVSTYAIILKSHTVLEEVIRELSLDMSYQQISQLVSITPVNSTQVMRITVTHGDPQTALRIVEHLVLLAPDAITNAMNAGSVKTVDMPWTTGKPIAPSKARYTVFVGMLAFCLTAGLLIVRYLLDDKFKTPGQITQYLGLPLLGVIPVEEKAGEYYGRSAMGSGRGEK